MVSAMRHGKTEHFVHGVEFKKLLDGGDLTHEDAALIFNVTSKTVRQWLRTGPEGTAAHFIGYMLAVGMPARHVADILRLQLSSIRRSMTKASERAKMIAKIRGKVATKPDSNVMDRIIQYLFDRRDGTVVAIGAGLGCYVSAASLRAALDSLVDAETIEKAGDSYSLAPFTRLKLQTAKDRQP